MGITVHYRGEWEINKNNLIRIQKALDYVCEFGRVLNWSALPLDEIGQVVSYGNSYDFFTVEEVHKLGYESRVAEAESHRFGIVLLPPVSGWVRVGEIWFTFYTFRGRYVLRSFVKTQAFGQKEYGNILVHELLIHMLSVIKSTWLQEMEVGDEGGFQGSLNHDTLVKKHLGEYRVISETMSSISGKE